MIVYRYNNNNKLEWDDFVATAKNTHFQFFRDYMEYHQDLYDDFSLIIKDEKQRIIALLPANKSGYILYSHEGLTFGGIIMSKKMRMSSLLNIFSLIINYLKKQGVSRLYYKSMPYIYHQMPAEEDRYALHKFSARLIRRDITSTIQMNQKINYSKGAKWAIAKARKEGVRILQSNEFSEFWPVLEKVLRERHNAAPVHSLQEIKHLVNKFPHNIRLFIATDSHQILAGAVIYENPTIAHTQYLANTVEGRKLGALNLLIDHLVKYVYSDKKYFDFGISTEKNGEYLNEGLIAQKEGFGAYAVAHDFYELDIT